MRRNLIIAGLAAIHLAAQYLTLGLAMHRLGWAWRAFLVLRSPALLFEAGLGWDDNLDGFGWALLAAFTWSIVLYWMAAATIRRWRLKRPRGK